jgi:hypothetical protein
MVDSRNPGALYWNKLEPIADSVSIYDGPEIFLEQFSAIHPALGNLLAAHWCHSEVTNGGFLQFFNNSTGVLAPEAAKAFRALGLEDCASVIEKAMAYFGKPYPRERQKRLEILATTTSDKGPKKSVFEELDGDFYKLLPWQDDTFEKAADFYAKLHLG